MLISFELTTLALVILSGWLFSRYRASVKQSNRAKEIVANQRMVISDIQLRAYRSQLDSEPKRERWDQLLHSVRRTGSGAVRLGHVMWMVKCIEEGLPDEPAPNLDPKPGAAWSLMQDPGAPAFARYINMRTSGDNLAAYGLLRKAAQDGSPWCQVAYGVALLRGEVPGFGVDETGRVWIEAGIEGSEGGCGLAELGFMLLDGVGMSADTATGAGLIERALARSDAKVATAVDYAQRIADGTHGLTKDPERAHGILMRFAPEWRRILDRSGVSQRKWTAQQIGAMREMRAAHATMSAAQLHQAEQALLRRLKQRDRA